MPKKEPDDRQPSRPACPACGGKLVEIRAKLRCSRCHRICEEEGDDPEIIEMERKDDIRRCVADLLLVEQAREWLLEKDT